MYFISTYWYGIGVLIALGGLGVWYGIRTQKRQNLAKGVVGLGNLAGRHYNEFTAAMGAPTDIEKQLANNTQEWVKIVTWRAGGYEIVLMFDDQDIFNRIVSESRYSTF